jgi:anti-anti-sigma regulatory factor
MGELDVTRVPGLEAAVGRVLSGSGERLVVDAGALEFVDSSAIALWVRWANQAGHVEIRDPPPPLRALIFRLGLAERLRLTP